MDTGLVELIILRTEDEGDTFYVVEPKDVPEKLKTPEMIAILNDGMQPQFPGEITIYMALRPGDMLVGNKIKQVSADVH